jgi:hypothetical protein
MRPEEGGNFSWGLLVFILVFTAAITWYFASPFVIGAWRANQIAAHGVPAQARILDLAATGTIINEQPLIAIKVEVMPAAGAPYVATFDRVLTIADVDEFRRGNVIPVKYDAAHPDRVAFAPGG